MLVDQLHGRLQVEAGQGARFVITFPAEGDLEDGEKPAA